MINKLTIVAQNLSPNLRKVLGSVGWLFADQVLRMSLSLFVGAWVARYLGPAQLGLYNYVFALVGLFIPFANLGLNQIVVRDLVNTDSAKYEILGTAFILKLVAGTLTFLVISISIYLLKPGDDLTLSLALLAAISTVFQAFEVIEFWFQSRVESRYIVAARSTSFILISFAKVILIRSHAPLIAFAWAGLAEIILSMLGLLIAYHRINGHHIKLWRCKLSQAKKLLQESWPLFLTGFAITVYMRIDQIMLEQMVGSESVGIYSAAVRLSEVWYFVPGAITSSVFPSIVEAKAISETLYYQRLKKLFNLMIGLALAIAIPMTFLSGHIIYILFGSAYTESGTVLAIHVWAALFVFLGTAQGPWNVTEGLQKLSLTRGLMGAGLNIILNFIFLPLYGAAGAAIATLISYAVPNYISNFFNSKTRTIFKIQTQALFLMWKN